MLKTLRIRSLAIIDDLTVEFGPGLNVLTGETGAGKSILVDALGLAAGLRADSSLVRSGAERAVVEAAFSCNTEALRAEVEARGIDAADVLVVRREVAAAGVGRVFLNGSPSTLSVLRELLDTQVELHGQHEHQSLLRSDVHLDLLDRFGGLSDPRARVEEAWRDLGEARLRAEAVASRRRERGDRALRLSRQVREIDAVAPRPGESEGLARERRLLQNAGRVAELLEGSVGLLYEGEPAAASLAAAAAKRLCELAEIDPGLRSLASRVDGARLELEDAGAFLRDYRDRADFDPGRLEAVEARLVALERLLLAYGPDEASALALREAASRELAVLEDLDAEAERAAAQIALAAGAYREAARALGEARRRAARDLAPAVEKQLHVLALPKARLAVAFAAARSPLLDDGGDPVPAGPRGAERAEILLTTNPGEEPRPLARIASGGELSRVMLALHVVLEASAPGGTLVFDEVDAGVGGAVADAVGSRLAALARRHQVLCVTHLPQVAAHADRHYHVRKRVVSDRTHAEVVLLSDEERVDELARMLGGREVTEASRRNAAELRASAVAGTPPPGRAPSKARRGA